MTNREKYILSIYEELSDMGKHENVKLVKNTVNDGIYIKKTLKNYNIEIYKIIKNRQIKGIPKVYEIIEDEKELIIIEEYIHGPNLQLTPNYTVFFIDGGLASDRTQEIFEATGVITDKTYMLTNKKGLEGKNIINPDFEINELITPLAFLPFFQILSYQITEDTHKWKKHPLMDEMKRLAGAKTLNYESSPLRKDIPQ